MAKKNYTPNVDGRSAEDKAMDKFAELMIEKISNLQGDWKSPGSHHRLPNCHATSVAVSIMA